jgi:hypothetical protein
VYGCDERMAQAEKMCKIALIGMNMIKTFHMNVIGHWKKEKITICFVKAVNFNLGMLNAINFW